MGLKLGRTRRYCGYNSDKLHFILERNDSRNGSNHGTRSVRSVDRGRWRGSSLQRPPHGRPVGERVRPTQHCSNCSGDTRVRLLQTQPSNPHQHRPIRRTGTALTPTVKFQTNTASLQVSTSSSRLSRPRSQPDEVGIGGSVASGPAIDDLTETVQDVGATRGKDKPDTNSFALPSPLEGQLNRPRGPVHTHSYRPWILHSQTSRQYPPTAGA